MNTLYLNHPMFYKRTDRPGGGVGGCKFRDDAPHPKISFNCWWGFLSFVSPLSKQDNDYTDRYRYKTCVCVLGVCVFVSVCVYILCLNEYATIDFVFPGVFLKNTNMCLYAVIRVAYCIRLCMYIFERYFRARVNLVFMSEKMCLISDE